MGESSEADMEKSESLRNKPVMLDSDALCSRFTMACGVGLGIAKTYNISMGEEQGN